MWSTYRKPNNHNDSIYDEFLALKKSDYWKFVSTNLKDEIDIFLAKNERPDIELPSNLNPETMNC